MAFAFGLAASSFFPALLMGIFSSRINRAGAICGMLAGISFTSGYIVYFQFFDGHTDQLLFGITPEGIGFVGMLINFVVAFAVCSFTQAPPAHIQAMVERIHIPSDDEGEGLSKQGDGVDGSLGCGVGRE